MPQRKPVRFTRYTPINTRLFIAQNLDERHEAATSPRGTHYHTFVVVPTGSDFTVYEMIPSGTGFALGYTVHDMHWLGRNLPHLRVRRFGEPATQNGRNEFRVRIWETFRICQNRLPEQDWCCIDLVIATLRNEQRYRVFQSSRLETLISMLEAQTLEDDETEERLV
ncbi:hypothetical protein O181_008033 [Austropuccinia psidii MF-1]|uniref:Uncharacterized protein n=1 Tax=Austropuccinia psidii MF-1 TaxID=1389203 RepID=A0A9Q3BNC5_9BASI|nr:hypothetical protein [Austropuccinia psidii MF-1]